MARAEFVADFGIVLAALIGVFNLQRNGRACCSQAARALIFENAGENFYLISFLALRGETVLAGLALIEEGLDFIDRDFEIRRATVNDSANRHPMAFAVSGDAEEVAEGVVRHEEGLNRLMVRVKPLVFAIL